MSTETLTYGERLLIQRRRRAESQTQAARRHKVSFYRYRAWELDDNGSETGPLPPFAAIGRLRSHEICFLMRRRADVKTETLARKLGCTPFWLSRMERGEAPVQRLVDYWIGTGAAAA